MAASFVDAAWARSRAGLLPHYELTVMLWFGWRAWPSGGNEDGTPILASVAEIARDCGVSAPTIDRALRSVREKNHLRLVAGGNGAPGGYLVNPSFAVFNQPMPTARPKKTIRPSATKPLPLFESRTVPKRKSEADQSVKEPLTVICQITVEADQEPMKEPLTVICGITERDLSDHGSPAYLIDQYHPQEKIIGGANAPPDLDLSRVPRCDLEGEGETTKVKTRRSAPVLPSVSTRILKPPPAGPTIAEVRANLQKFIHAALDSGRYYNPETRALDESELLEALKTYVARERIEPSVGRWIPPNVMLDLIRSVVGHRATRAGRPRVRTLSGQELIRMRAAAEQRAAARRGEQFLASIAEASR